MCVCEVCVCARVCEAECICVKSVLICTYTYTHINTSTFVSHTYTVFTHMHLYAYIQSQSHPHCRHRPPWKFTHTHNCTYTAAHTQLHAHSCTHTFILGTLTHNYTHAFIWFSHIQTHAIFLPPLSDTFTISHIQPAPFTHVFIRVPSSCTQGWVNWLLNFKWIVCLIYFDINKFTWLHGTYCNDTQHNWRSALQFFTIILSITFRCGIILSFLVCSKIFYSHLRLVYTTVSISLS